MPSPRLSCPHTIKAIFITRPPLGPQPIPTRFHFFTSTRVSLSVICLWNKPCISPLSLCQLPSPNQTSFNIPSSCSSAQVSQVWRDSHGSMPLKNNNYLATPPAFTSPLLASTCSRPPCLPSAMLNLRLLLDQIAGGKIFALTINNLITCLPKYKTIKAMIRLWDKCKWAGSVGRSVISPACCVLFSSEFCQRLSPWDCGVEIGRLDCRSVSP